MPSSAAILEEIRVFAQEATAEPPLPNSEITKAKHDLLVSADAIANRARALKNKKERLREGLENFVTLLEAAPGAVDFGEVIETLRATETQMKNTIAPYINRVKSTRRGVLSLRSLTPGERARAVGVVDYYIKTLNEALEMLRDYRWRVMTLRADHEAAGDAPVFDDADKLIEFVNAHSG